MPTKAQIIDWLRWAFGLAPLADPADAQVPQEAPVPQEIAQVANVSFVITTGPYVAPDGVDVQGNIVDDSGDVLETGVVYHSPSSNVFPMDPADAGLLATLNGLAQGAVERQAAQSGSTNQ